MHATNACQLLLHAYEYRTYVHLHACMFRRNAFLAVLMCSDQCAVCVQCGTIHRGVACSGSQHRAMFWMSVKKHADLVELEPSIQRIIR